LFFATLNSPLHFLPARAAAAAAAATAIAVLQQTPPTEKQHEVAVNSNSNYFMSSDCNQRFFGWRSINIVNEKAQHY